MWRSTTALILYTVLYCQAGQYCRNCPKQWENYILGIVNRAVHQEHRNIFYNFYSDWISELINPDTTVTINYIEQTALKGISARYKRNAVKEPFQVIFSFQYEMASTPGMSDRLANDIDSFLTLNPCWLPLLEPCSFNCTRLLRTMKTYADVNWPQYWNSIVLLRLPSAGFMDSCIFYEKLVSRQFPKQCRFESSHMVSFAVHNIGWSHTVHTMVDVMMGTLMEKHDHKIFVVPYAEQYHSKNQDLLLPNGTIIKRLRSGWYWANEQTCPSELYQYNPWACNFLSFSSCSNQDTLFYLPQDTRKISWGGDVTYMQKRLGITRESRKLHGDGPLMNDRKWVQHRLLSFLTRPNYRMRQMIRRSINKIKPISRIYSSGMSTVHPMSQYYRDGGEKINDRNINIKISGSLFLRQSISCIALHVRHGDSIYDMRNNNNTDRSIHGHIDSLKNISIRLGTNVVYLLTDNATIPRYVVSSYPEYHWFMQIRPMRSKRQKIFDVKNEEDIQLELAHLLADIIVGGSCAAVVGCFDSGMAVQVQNTIEDRSRLGRIYESQFVNVLGNVVRGWVPPLLE